MADSSRHNLFFVPEDTYGTTPANPALTKLRHKGTTLGLAKGSVTSEEIRADRQVQDFRHGTKQVGGDVTCELCYAAFDALLEAVLCGTWAAEHAQVAKTTISAAAADNSYNDSGAGLPVYTVGDTVTIAGFTTAGNNGAAVVVSSTASKLVVSGLTLTDETAGDTVTITQTNLDVLKAGVVRRSFSMLRNFGDIETADKPYHMFTGVELAKLDLKVTPGAIVELGFGLVGKGMSTATAAPAGATYPAADTHSPMDSFSGAVLVDAVENGVVTELTTTLENGIEARFVVGSAETIRPSIGRSNMSGQLSVYFEDSDMIDRFLDETETAISYVLGDGTQGYRITYPRVKFTGGQPDVKGAGPITLTMPFQALYSTSAGTQIIVKRLRSLT